MIEIKNLNKTFKTEVGTVEALKNINFTVEDGEIYGIIGMSGAGKSTLVRCINMIEKPTSGDVRIDDVDLTKLQDWQLREIRRDVTMIFQSFNLLMQKNVRDNIELPLKFAGVNKKKSRKTVNELLELVGLGDKASAYPAQLSGGQRQRVAIARALATNPKVLLCDEATSALDPKTTGQILDLIRDINKKLGITVVIITHQMSVVQSICDKVAIIDHGEIVERGKVSEIFANPKSEAAKRLVFPERQEAIVASESSETIEVLFNESETTHAPLITSLAQDKGICASIIYASTKSVEGKAFGRIVLEVPNDPKIVDEAVKYLSAAHGVTVTVGSSKYRDDKKTIENNDIGGEANV